MPIYFNFKYAKIGTSHTSKYGGVDERFKSTVY